MKKPEYLIATTVILGAILFVAALSFSIGKLRYAGGNKRLRIVVESAAGIIPNTPVKFAGAPIGRVESVSVLPRDKQEMIDDHLYSVEVITTIDPKIEIGDDVVASVDQDGMLGSNYIALIPHSNTSPLLADNAVLRARANADITDLTNSGRELITKMIPVADHLKGMTKQLDESLPLLTENLNDVLTQTDELLKMVNNPENKEHLQKLMANLRVVAENMKVVSTNAKALTLTLAQKPWRLLWGGPTNPVPPESEVLKSEKPIQIKNVINPSPANVEIKK